MGQYGGIALGRPSRWVYVLPTVHLCACLASFIGLVIPRLQLVGILFTFILLADLPVSAPAFALGSKYGTLVVIWIFLAGTIWWYLLSRAALALLNKSLRRDTPSA